MTATNGAPAGDFVERAAERLLAVTGAERRALLAELVALHPDRADALRELCAELDGVERLLHAGYADPSGAPPSQIGGHRVLRRLGAGAFGIVYLCQQQRPIVRDVAIKVLRPGAGDPKTLQRFAAERQLLAQLNHPGITQVYDAGELPDGRPFFVMEYVDGTPIHEWCVANRVSCEARVRLFVELCRAVAHAHARGIVHRDLKPANVLVVATSDGPIPKVIDFGIAKALGGSRDDGELRTETGRVIGTPGYMSPEQAAGRIDEVDARADVFALGVMLYQLLTDRLPWPRQSTASETEPTRPSARVTTNDGTAPRPHDANGRAAELRGDLDWITLRAIARDRDDRYASVADLVADLERHLRGDTVSVGPPSLARRVRKFARRRRAVVVATSTVVLAAIGVAFALRHAAVMQHEADDARHAAAIEHASSRDVVARMLERANDPALYGSAHGDELRSTFAAEAAAFAERLLAVRSNDAPLLLDHCEALQVVAEVQRLVGQPKQAATVASEAVAVAMRLHTTQPDDADRRATLGRAMRQEAWTKSLTGDRLGACARLREAIAHLEASAAANPSKHQQALAIALADLATLTPAKDRELAIPNYERALTIFDQLASDATGERATRDDRVTATLGLARLLFDDDRLDAASARLATIADRLPDLDANRLRATCEFHRLKAKIAWARGDRRPALADHHAAADAGDEWCRVQPRRTLAHRLRLMATDELGQAALSLGDPVVRLAAAQRAVTAVRAMVANFPEEVAPRVMVVTRCFQLATILVESRRRSQLPAAAENCAAALDADVALGETRMEGRLARWRLLLLHARIETARGAATADDAWRELETRLPLDEVDSAVQHLARIDAFLGITAMCLRANDTTTARKWLERASDALDGDDDESLDRRLDAAWLAARLAVATNDLAGAVAAADRLESFVDNGHATLHAAESLRLALPLQADPTAAANLQQRARSLFCTAIERLAAARRASPDDPWAVIPWAAATIRAAEAGPANGDAAATLATVDAALAALDAVRAETCADEWDEAAYTAGMALRERLRH